MKSILITFSIFFFCSTSYAAIIEISSLNISAGNVLINGTINTGLLPGEDPFIRMGDYQGVLDAGNIFGSIVTNSDPVITPFYGITLSSYGGNTYSAPTGTINDVLGTITVDMRSWFVWQQNPSAGTLINNGGIATGTYNSLTGEFNMSWDGLIENGTFPDPNTWTLNGTVNIVPIPASMWLFGSGLIGLIGFARRKKV